MKTSRARPAGQRAMFQARRASADQPYSCDHRVADGASGDEQQEPGADRQRQDRREHGRAPVLRQRLAVPADAVDAVAAALDLRHRRGHRERARTPARSRARPRRSPRTPRRRRRPGRRPSRRRVTTASIVAATTRAGRSSSMSAARPVSAIRNGTTARQACSARARLLVKPSPYRNRTNESTSDPPQAVAAGEVPGVLGVELVAVQLGRHRDGAGSGHAGQAMRARMGQAAAGPVQTVRMPLRTTDELTACLAHLRAAPAEVGTLDLVVRRPRQRRARDPAGGRARRGRWAWSATTGSPGRRRGRSRRDATSRRR